MNTDKLKIFLNLADSLSFSRTAQNLGITQSAVSQSISSLEDYVGTKLFYRSRKEVSLTPAGKLLAEGLKPVITQYDKAVTHAREVADANGNMLTIGFSGSGYDNYAIKKLVTAFQKDYPEVKIFLENYDHRTLINRLKQGFLDVVLTRPESFGSANGLTYEKMLEGKFYAVLGEGYSYRGGIPVTRNDLAKERMIFLDKNWCLPKQASLQQYLIEKVSHLDYAIANNMTDYTQMIEAGLGIGICAEFVVDPSNQKLRLLPIDKDVTGEIGLVRLSDSRMPAAEAFMTWVKERGLPKTHSVDN
ncbi:LysR family transcriptional regulator [Lactobacillus sp.]|uniref:LysR family transcriptional regulator n=1 Tax=Lactobacillus sp. TaxID=1591 RepID=UPI003EF7840A